MKNKILIFGNGFIGERLQKEWQCDITSRRIGSCTDAEEEIKKFKPRVVINCIGFTGGKNVDGCELEKDKTLNANTFVPLILAEVCLRNKIKFVHISSGCIYHYDYAKQKPISENNLPDFFDLFYSRSKIYSERALDILSEKYGVLTVRIRIPMDDRPNPKNIIDKLVRYGKVIDVPNSITYIPDFVKALRHLISRDARGIYNVVNKGGLRYPELMKIYKQYVPGFRYEVIPYKKLKLVRTNLIMSVSKLEKTGFKVRRIQDVLEECIKNYTAYTA